MWCGEGAPETYYAPRTRVRTSGGVSWMCFMSSATGDGTDTPDRVFTLTAAGQTTQTFVVDGDPASPEPSTVVTTVAPTTTGSGEGRSETIAEMAAIITENPLERAGAPKLARMSRKIDSMMEEDGSG